MVRPLCPDAEVTETEDTTVVEDGMVVEDNPAKS